MSNRNLLVELFVEELPPKSLKKLGESFAEALAASLKAQGLADSNTPVTTYASPRRLGVHVANVAAQAADKSVSQKLMPVAVGLDAKGQATPALLKKLAGLGVDASVVARLRHAPDGKAETLFFDSVLKGATLAEGLQRALEDAVAKLPIAKVMSYQLEDGWTSVNFVRPAHGLVALHGADVVPVGMLGLTAGRETQGHRFEANVAKIVLKDADRYEAQMETEGAVIPSFENRRAEIVNQLAAAAEREGLQPVEDDALLDEVTALVERPNVLLGQFETEFLEVPQECLILTMKVNQKYFPLLDASGKLTSKFLIVSNIGPADASLVVGGNERVVRPRLADAKFFFDQDRKKSLMDRLPGLAKVVYHNKLGSQGDRVERVAALASAIGHKLGGEVLAHQADQAADLAKTDLLTDMVDEFPELQGIMGRYYALHDGLPADIADAIEDHYKPRFAGDELPRGQVGLVVALADKLQTLVDMFGIGQVPTGDKDPFALRRHALGVIRMLIERDLTLELDWLFHAARLADAQTITALSDFIYDRLAVSLREQGYSPQEVDAVVGLRPQRLGDIPKRLAAVRAFAALDAAKELAAANKRVQNIMRKNQEELGAGLKGATVRPELFREPAERDLYQAVLDIAPFSKGCMDRREYGQNLKALVTLKPFIDDFFEKVMVMCEDKELRVNRAVLLQQLGKLMNQVADISRLAA